MSKKFIPIVLEIESWELISELLHKVGVSIESQALGIPKFKERQKKYLSLGNEISKKLNEVKIEIEGKKV